MQHVEDMIRENAGLTEFDHRTSEGDNLLIAVDGEADVFSWELSDADGEGASDVILNFDVEEDSLDIRDLINVDDLDSVDISDYVSVTTSDSGDTVVKVSSNGELADGNGYDQMITLEGVDLLAGNDLDSVIRDMLDSGSQVSDS